MQDELTSSQLSFLYREILSKCRAHYLLLLKLASTIIYDCQANLVERFLEMPFKPIKAHYKKQGCSYDKYNFRARERERELFEPNLEGSSSSCLVAHKQERRYLVFVSSRFKCCCCCVLIETAQEVEVAAITTTTLVMELSRTLFELKEVVEESLPVSFTVTRLAATKHQYCSA